MDHPIKFRLVSPREVVSHWDTYVPLVEQIIHRCRASFRPEDVYRELTSGEVFMYEFLYGEEWMGFTVLSEYKDRYTMDRVLCLDMTYIRPHSQQLDLIGGRIRAFAKEHGFDRIDWFSPRRGWDQKLEEIGFKSDSMLFTCEVPNG